MTINSITDYELPGLGPCVRLVNAQPVLPVLKAAMSGWPLAECPRQSSEPDICVWGKDGGFWQQAPALPKGMWLDTSVGAACSVIADVAGAFLRHHTDYVGLHCGSAEINGQLVIFPESHRAGKSTLTAAFAAAGYRVFGDDVVALTPKGEGVSLGIAPRLRLPLPRAIDEAFQDFVATHQGPSDSRYGYLKLDETLLANHGDKRPIGAIILIDRDSNITTPQLTSLQHGEGLWQLLKQNFADTLSDHELITKFLPLVKRIPCFLLRYSDAYNAAEFVGRNLEGALKAQSIAYLSPSCTAAAPTAPALDRDDKRCWRACKTAHEYPLGNELFVIIEEGGAIHRMNVTSRAIWLLLQNEALDIGELSETLTGFFMPVSREQVTKDVAELLGQFLSAGLIEAVKCPN
ncbi:MAG: PqqD family peptide modification chaperone [Halomonas sp.]|nr:PqqD family protein [Halomonas sp.]TVP46644.1 MAG: PqqD family peptide modification chaperone [Halomonas sp.]